MASACPWRICRLTRRPIFVIIEFDDLLNGGNVLRLSHGRPDGVRVRARASRGLGSDSVAEHSSAQVKAAWQIDMRHTKAFRKPEGKSGKRA